MQIDERHPCLVCGERCASEVQIAFGRFPIVQFECPFCAIYALSYTLWFRLKLSGWEGPAMEQVRSCLMQCTAGESSADSKKRPLVVAQAERQEAGAIKQLPDWEICLVD